jgi:hypothetical protein
MDEVDLAQTEIEHSLRGYLALATNLQAVAGTGACLNCGEPLRPQLRWCDAGCRDDWARCRAQAAHSRRPGRAGPEGSAGVA